MAKKKRFFEEKAPVKKEPETVLLDDNDPNSVITKETADVEEYKG